MTESLNTSEDSSKAGDARAGAADTAATGDAPQPTTPLTRSDPRYEGATPPGYDDWPTHGGYLGCLIGLMTAVLVAPLGYIFFGFLGAYLAHPLGGFGVALALVVTVAAYLAVFIALTRLGWALGKRFLREYDSPRPGPRWGMDDDEDAAGATQDADYPLVIEATPPGGEHDTNAPHAPTESAH